MNTKSLNEEICTFIINELKSYKTNVIPRGFSSLVDWKREIKNGIYIFEQLRDDFIIQYQDNIQTVNEYSDHYIDAMRWLTLYMVSLNE